MVSLSPTTAGAAIRLVTGRTPLAADREDEGFVVDVGTDRWAVVPVPTPPSLEFDLDAVLECFEADVVWDPAPRPEAVAVTSPSELYHLNDPQGLAALWRRIAGVVSATDLADILVAYQARGPRQTVMDDRSDWREFVGASDAELVPHPTSLAWTGSPGERQLDFASWSIYLGVDTERHGLELYHWRVRATAETLEWTVTEVGRNLPSPFLHRDRGAR